MDPIGTGMWDAAGGGKFGSVVGTLLRVLETRSLLGEHLLYASQIITRRSLVHHEESFDAGRAAGANSFNAVNIKVVLQHAATPAMHLEPNASKVLQNLYSQPLQQLYCQLFYCNKYQQ